VSLFLIVGSKQEGLVVVARTKRYTNKIGEGNICKTKREMKLFLVAAY
jgi:hypothetical protein